MAVWGEMNSCASFLGQMGTLKQLQNVSFPDKLSISKKADSPSLHDPVDGGPKLLSTLQYLDSVSLVNVRHD